jgi:elongation factor Ts
MDCKKALQESEGDIEKALEIIRKRGKEIAAKKAVREASEGLTYAYVHPPGKVATLIELNCESDFVAKNEKFQSLCKDIAMHITAMSPAYVSREDVPESAIEKQKEIFADQARNEKKPEKIIDKIVTGKMERFFSEKCLLEQPYIKDSDKTVKEYIEEHVALLGENIVLRRFTRYAVGEIEEDN